MPLHHYEQKNITVLVGQCYFGNPAQSHFSNSDSLLSPYEQTSHGQYFLPIKYQCDSNDLKIENRQLKEVQNFGANVRKLTG